MLVLNRRAWLIPFAGQADPLAGADPLGASPMGDPLGADPMAGAADPMAADPNAAALGAAAAAPADTGYEAPVTQKPPKFNVYTGVLALSLLALTIACLLLYMELSSYPGDFGTWWKIQ